MFSKIPLLIVCIAALFSTCSQKTDLGERVGPYKSSSVAIPQLPSFSECTLASNLKLSENVPFILKTPLNEVNNPVNKFSLEFNSKYNSSKVSVVGIEWKIDGKISPNESTDLTLKMVEGREYDIVCSVYSTDYKSVYKKDIEFCASKNPIEKSLEFKDCKPLNIEETNCKNNSIAKSNNSLRVAIAIIYPFSKELKI